MDDGTAEPGARGMSVLGAAGWALLVEIVFVIVVQLVESARGGASADLVTLTTGRVLAYVLVFFAILRVHEPETEVRAALGLRAPRAVHALLGAVVGGALAPGASWLNDLVTKRFPPPPAEVEALERLLAGDTLGKRIALVVTLGLVLPVADELFFRGAIFTPQPRRTQADVARVVVATALFDTLVLASTRGVPSMLVTALALGLLRVRGHSAVPSALGRASFFLVSLYSVALGRPEWEVSATVAAASAVGAAVALALYVAIPARGANAAAGAAR